MDAHLSPGLGCGDGNHIRKSAIVVFTRLPVPGRVKTRLAAGAGVGPDSACDFYRACAAHAIDQAASCHGWAHVYIYHSSGDDTSQVKAWLASEGLLLPCSPQAGAAPGATGPDLDLGAKMRAAMVDAAQRDGGHRKILIMGTDIPDLSAQTLKRAADALDEYQMVVGPALDGGYYLMGLDSAQLDPRLFQDMAWSTDSVLAETLVRAAAAGLRVAPLETLPALRDVDTVQDLAEWVLGSLPDAARGGNSGRPGHPTDGGQEPLVHNPSDASPLLPIQGGRGETPGPCQGPLQGPQQLGPPWRRGETSAGPGGQGRGPAQGQGQRQGDEGLGGRAREEEGQGAARGGAGGRQLEGEGRVRMCGGGCEAECARSMAEGGELGGGERGAGSAGHGEAAAGEGEGLDEQRLAKRRDRLLDVSRGIVERAARAGR